MAADVDPGPGFTRFFDERPPVPAAIHAVVQDGIPALVDLAALLLRRCADDGPFAAVWAVLLPCSNAAGLRRRVAAVLAVDEPTDAPLLRFSTWSPTDAGLDALLTVLAAVPPRTIVLVEHADYYHVPAASPPPRATVPGPLGTVLELRHGSDLWVPSLCGLAATLRARPWLADGHVVLLVDRSPPTLAEHLDALDAHFENWLLCRRGDDLDDATITAKLGEWRRLLDARGADALHVEVDAFTPVPLIRAQLLAHCFGMSRRWEEAYQTLSSAAGRLRVRPPGLLHILASAALNTARLDEVRAVLLELGAAERVDESELRNAHLLARQAKDVVAEGALLRRMRTDYPRSRYLVRVEALDRHSAEDFVGVLALRGQLQDDPDLRTIFVRAEHRCGRISRDELLARLCELEPEILALELSMLIDAAIAGHHLDDARTLLRRLCPDAPHAGHCVLAGCRLLQALTRDPAATDAARAEVFDVVLRHVADHPEDIDARAGLTRAIAVEDMGLAGVALVLGRLQSATQVPPLHAGPPPRDMGRDVTDAEAQALVQFIQQQYMEDGPQGIQLAPEVLRVQRTEAEWRDLLRAAGPVFRLVVGNITDASNAFFPQLVVKAILDIWRTLRSIGADVSDTLPLEVLHALAQALAIAGLVQQARDLADLLLTYAGSHAPAETRRAGWVAHADIQLRTSRVEAALLGLLCAQTQPASALDPEERYNELELHVRLLRTLHQYDQALAHVPALRATLADIPESGRLMRKIDDLELGLRFVRLPDPIPADRREELQDLLAVACRSTEFAVAAREEILVPMNWLAQLLHACEVAGVATDAARSLFDRSLAELPSPLQVELRARAASTIDVDTLLRHARAASQARAAEDLGAHLERLRSDAYRLLSGPCAPEHALVAMELLADPTLECGSPERSAEDQRIDALHRRILRGYHFLTHGPDAVPEMPAVPEVVMRGIAVDAPFPSSNTWKDPERLRGFACDLGSGDLELVALSWQDGRVIRVDVRDGAIAGPVVEAATDASPHTWRAALQPLFIAAGGDDPSGVAATQAAMRGLGFTTPAPADRGVLYLLAHPLVGVPANLLLRNGELSGMLSPVAAVPSLSWLLERRRQPPRARGRRAWILPASDDAAGPRGPLALLADNLPRALPGFTVEAAFPSPTQPLEIALLAAHGGTDEHDFYFSAVGDERAHHFSIARVAAALAGCELVVLLVCSGGRTDAAPFSTRSVGLPSALLGAGCRTVVASPWPLDALVALRWTALFLDAWTPTTAVVTAVHRANLALGRTHCHPRDFLAMHVFGDPALHPRSSHRGADVEPIYMPPQ